MLQGVALNGREFERKEYMQDPKAIFEYLWKEFSLRAEQEKLPPLVFFIKKHIIEVFDFTAFTTYPEGKNIFGALIAERVKQELDIEGVAISIEAETQERVSDKYNVYDTVLLSMDWRDIIGTFARVAKKVKTKENYRLIDIVDANAFQGKFTNFFQTASLKDIKERTNLQ